MAKLYDMLSTPCSDQPMSFLSYPDKDKRQCFTPYPTNSATEYRFVEEEDVASKLSVYELREPRPVQDPVEGAKKQNTDIKALLGQATVLCNDLDELIALHYCFYEAVENVFDRERGYIGKDSKECSSKAGLSLFPHWLRERDFTVLESMHKLQQSLLQLCDDSKRQKSD